MEIVSGPYIKRGTMGSIELPDPHWEALTPETQQAYRIIADFEFIHDLKLARGTGLALHLGHRFSVDLDFFSPKLNAVSAHQRLILREKLDDLHLYLSPLIKTAHLPLSGMR